MHETEAAVVDRNGTDLPRLGFTCENIAPIEKPDKTEAIQNVRTRFEALGHCHGHTTSHVFELAGCLK